MTTEEILERQFSLVTDEPLPVLFDGVRMAVRYVSMAQLALMPDTPADLTPTPAATDLLIPLFMGVEFIPGSQQIADAVGYGGQVVIGSMDKATLFNAGFIVGTLDPNRFKAAVLNDLTQNIVPLVTDVRGKPIQLNSAGGGIGTVTINDPGADYLPGDDLTVNTGNGDGVLSVDTVDGDGGVTGVTVTTAGTYYFNATGVATTTDSQDGTGCTINITSCTPSWSDGDGCGLLVYTVYVQIPGF